MRMALRHRLQSFMGHQRHAARGDGDDVVLEPLEREAVQVRKVAGDMQLDKLPLARRQILRARHPAFQEQG